MPQNCAVHRYLSHAGIQVTMRSNWHHIAQRSQPRPSCSFHKDLELLSTTKTVRLGWVGLGLPSTLVRESNNPEAARSCQLEPDHRHQLTGIGISTTP